MFSAPCWPGCQRKKQGGTITLRIEDLDKPRCPAGSDMLLEDDLHWLGLEWDTGGSAGGKDAPYYQSRRFDIYAAYFAQLQKLGLTYPCFCNRLSCTPPRHRI